MQLWIAPRNAIARAERSTAYISQSNVDHSLCEMLKKSICKAVKSSIGHRKCKLSVEQRKGAI